MLNKFWNYITIIIILISIIIIINCNNNNNDNKNKNIDDILVKETEKIKEYFLVKNNDPENDGKMRYEYLNNPNYANSILSRYYVNDDRKIGGVRLVNHPYQVRYSPNGRDKYYGSLYWDKARSDNIYKNTGIRL
jgi:hypothetical protein